MQDTEENMEIISSSFIKSDNFLIELEFPEVSKIKNNIITNC